MSGANEGSGTYYRYWQAAGLVLAIEELGISVISARTFNALPCNGDSHFIELSTRQLLQFHKCNTCQRPGTLSVFHCSKKDTLIGFLDASVLNGFRSHQRHVIAMNILKNRKWESYSHE